MLLAYIIFCHTFHDRRDSRGIRNKVNALGVNLQDFSCKIILGDVFKHRAEPTKWSTVSYVVSQGDSLRMIGFTDLLAQEIHSQTTRTRHWIMERPNLIIFRMA